MSVAFRRESDEEHLEPRFERPIPPGPNPVTARGLRLIEEEVATLEARLRDPLDETARAAATRDLRYWRRRLATAEVVTPSGGDEVAFGSRVRFRLNGREQRVRLVGHDEADAANGTLAVTAPLARALLGAGPGDLLPFAGRADALEVLDVAPGGNEPTP